MFHRWDHVSGRCSCFTHSRFVFCRSDRVESKDGRQDAMWIRWLLGESVRRMCVAKCVHYRVEPLHIHTLCLHYLNSSCLTSQHLWNDANPFILFIIPVSPISHIFFRYLITYNRLWLFKRHFVWLVWNKLNYGQVVCIYVQHLSERWESIFKINRYNK